ncbi:MAG: winged helix-turn-helix domain-containing protein [Cellulosilyticaceae bacterium]
MDRKYLVYLANAKLNATEYKIILLLLTGAYTATQVSSELKIMEQNKARHFKKLKGMGLIEVDDIEGRNKYYRAVTDMRKLVEVMPGQIKI